jgi:hypothetical protein
MYACAHVSYILPFVIPCNCTVLRTVNYKRLSFGRIAVPLADAGLESILKMGIEGENAKYGLAS